MSLPFQRVFWGDELRKTLALDQAQFGALMLLRAAYWCRGGALPDDDGQLAAITRTRTAAQWQRLRPVVAGFFQIAGGEWRSEEIEAELEEAMSRAGEGRSRAQRAAAERWRREREKRAQAQQQLMLQACSEHAPSIAPGMPGAMLGDASSSSSSDPNPLSPSPPPITPPGERAAARLEGDPPNGELQAAGEEPQNLNRSALEVQRVEGRWRALAGADGPPPPAPGRIATWRKAVGGVDELLAVLDRLGVAGVGRGADYVHQAVVRGAASSGHAAATTDPGVRRPPSPFARKVHEARLRARARAKLA